MIDVIGLVWFNFRFWLISQRHNPDPLWQTFFDCKAHKRIFQHPLGWVLHLDKELHREMWLENNFIKWGKDWGSTDQWVISGILGVHSLNFCYSLNYTFFHNCLWRIIYVYLTVVCMYKLPAVQYGNFVTTLEVWSYSMTCL